MKRLISFVTVLLLTAAPGCVSFDFQLGGGTDSETYVESQTVTPTLGEQLVDLQAAYRDKAIDETQYDSAKEQLLGGTNGSPSPAAKKSTSAERTLQRLEDQTALLIGSPLQKGN